MTKLEQSIDHTKITTYATNNPGSSTHTLTPIERVWLMVAIEFLLENKWLIRTDDQPELHHELMAASFALHKS